MTRLARWSVLGVSAVLLSFGSARDAAAQFCTGCNSSACVTECQNPDTYEWTTCAQFTGCNCLPWWQTTSNQVIGVKCNWIGSPWDWEAQNLHLLHQVDPSGCYGPRDICNWAHTDSIWPELELCEVYQWGSQSCPV